MATELPAGLVTFLLTDIEGSTRLFRRLGDGWPPLLDLHLDALRTAMEEHGGVEFKSEGDALLAAFGSASAAFQAAVEAQARLRAVAWPPDAVVKVRMGLHTGLAHPRDGDYIALALHQAARVVGAGHGGQVLASLDAVRAAGDPPGLRSARLGAYRLRDFDGTAELFQVTAAATSEETFPALRAVAAEGHNLERPADSFVGRDGDLSALERLTVPGRLVSVCGPGGMGKTRLVTEFGLRAADRWGDGVWMVELAAIAQGQPIAAALAMALGVPIDDDVDNAIVEHLRTRRALVILDNCEHVIDTVRPLVRLVLATCPDVALLATTRERLAVRGEQVHTLAPLPVSDECIDLFAARARERGSVLDMDEDREALTEICRRLDGMPLAIELAAARSNVLTAREILQGLETQVASLRRRDGDLTERQRTLRGLLDWSYRLLDPDERAVFRRVSVFVGSFDLSAAAAAAGFDEDDVPDLVWSLVDKSLVGIEQRDGSTRYRMLETVRAVALVYCDDAREGAIVRCRLGEWYLGELPWVDSAKRWWRARVALEQATMRSLAEWLLEPSHRDAGADVDLGFALGRYSIDLALESQSATAVEFLLHLIASAPGRSATLARLHATVAQTLAGQGHPEAAQSHLDEARRLIDEFGTDDRLGPVRLLGAQTQISLRLGTEEALRQALVAARVELARPLPPAMRADSLVELALVGQSLGDEEVVDILHEAISIAERLDEHATRMFALNNLAEQEMRSGNLAAAARHQRDAMLVAADLGAPLVTAFGLVVAARMAHWLELDQIAVHLHSAADVLLEECGYLLLPDDRELSDIALAGARLALGDRYDEDVARGRALSLMEAIGIAEEVFAEVIRGDGTPRA